MLGRHLFVINGLAPRRLGQPAAGRSFHLAASVVVVPRPQLQSQSSKASVGSSLPWSNSSLPFPHPNRRRRTQLLRTPALGFSSSARLCAVREYDEEEMRNRRSWLAKFQDVKLRREDYDTSFARSSGPGGQNVNKLNTKAEVRLDLSQAAAKPPPPGTPDASPRSWLTRDLASRLAKQSSYYVASSHSLLVTSMRHRTQEANLQDALDKLHAHVLEVASEGIVGETSEEQRRRVRALEAAEQRRKKANKIKRSDVKSGRKFKG